MANGVNRVILIGRLGRFVVTLDTLRQNGDEHEAIMVQMS